MQITVLRESGYVVAKTNGALDEMARDAFRSALHPLVGQKGTRLIVDLSGSTRINSPGVGNLVALVADANTNGSRVIYCALPAMVSGVMSVTKLDTFFEIAGTLDEAITRAQAPPPKRG